MDAADIIEIHQLLGRYGHIVDAAEWDRFDELFDADAELDYTGVRAPRCTAASTRSGTTSAVPNHPPPTT